MLLCLKRQWGAGGAAERERGGRAARPQPISDAQAPARRRARWRRRRARANSERGSLTPGRSHRRRRAARGSCLRLPSRGRPRGGSRRGKIPLRGTRRGLEPGGRLPLGRPPAVASASRGSRVPGDVCQFTPLRSHSCLGPCDAQGKSWLLFLL